MTLGGGLSVLAAFRGGLWIRCCGSMAMALLLFAFLAKYDVDDQISLAVGGVLGLLYLPWSITRREGLKPQIFLWIGLASAGAIMVVGRWTADPPPHFHDPFTTRFEQGFADEGLPVLEHDQNAYRISGRGSYTDAETYLLVDISKPCPEGGIGCVQSAFAEIAWMQDVEILAGARSGNTSLVRFSPCRTLGSLPLAATRH